MSFGAPAPGRGSRARWPRTLRFTSWGTRVVWLALGIGFAALNTGNNLLYILFGLLLGLILASGLVSEGVLRAAQAAWILPKEAFAQQPVALRLIIKNKSRWPLLGLEAWVRFAPPQTPSREVGPLGFFFIPPRGQRSGDLALLSTARGVLRVTEIRLGTAFPFGFFEKSLRVDVDEERIVFPALVRVPRRLSPLEGQAPRLSQLQRGPGDTFWGLREFQEGDSPRRIAWKTAARLGRLVVSETERDADRRLTLDLGGASEWAALSPVDQESALSFAASLALVKWAEGFAVGLRAGASVLLPGRGPRERRALLTRLALLDPKTLGETGDAISGAWPLLPLWGGAR